MKKFLKILKWLGLSALGLFLIDAGVVLYFAHLKPVVLHSDAIVVMGAAVGSPTLDSRIQEALKLYEQNRAPVIVLSGGKMSERHISEATYMQRVLQQSTTKPLNVILEEQSHSTYENLKNSKAKLGAADSIIIVTDNYHVARSVLVARRVGFKKVSWSVPLAHYSDSELVYYYLREMLAMVDYLPKLVFN